MVKSNFDFATGLTRPPPACGGHTPPTPLEKRPISKLCYQVWFEREVDALVDFGVSIEDARQRAKSLTPSFNSMHNLLCFVTSISKDVPTCVK